MKCSKCGYERQSRDDAFVPLSECPACGVVYAKHDSAKTSGPAVSAVTPPHLKPSPVDAISLRKARERVEKRLRERHGTRIKDERHNQTLELAKRLTSEQIRKRRSEWKQTHPEKQTSQPPGEESASAGHGLEAKVLDTANPAPSKGELPSDHPPIDSMQETAEKMTPAQHPSPGTDDSLTQTVEKSTDPADESRSATAQEQTVTSADETQSMISVAAPVEEETVMLDDVVVDSTDQPSDSIQEETPRIMASTQQHRDQNPTQPELPLPAAHLASEALQHPHKIGLTRLLPVVAWMILGAGVIGAVLSWTTIGDVEAGVRIPIPESMSALPLGLLLGFAYLATGVLGFAFFWVSSLISIQLRDIHHLLRSEERGSN